MSTTILIIIGILLILYSLLVIKKDILKDKSIVEELSIIEAKVKDYYDLTEETILDFDELIDSKLKVINDEKYEEDMIGKYNQSNVKNEVDIANSTDLIVDSTHKDVEIANPSHKKILQLYSLGLTKIEIAKTLNKGVREIEIVLKLYSNKDI